MNNTKTSFITKGSFCAALSILLIYLSNILVVNKLFLLGAASVLIPICILMTSIKISFLVYTSVSIISFLLLGFRLPVLSYIIFFGLYGFIKLYIEKLHNFILEILLKLVFFNICIVVVYYLYTTLFIPEINLPYSKYLVLIGLQVIFLIYDYALAVFIDYFNKKFVKKIK